MLLSLNVVIFYQLFYLKILHKDVEYLGGTTRQSHLVA